MFTMCSHRVPSKAAELPISVAAVPPAVACSRSTFCEVRVARGEGRVGKATQLTRHREAPSSKPGGRGDPESRRSPSSGSRRRARDDDSSGGSVVTFAALDDLTAKRSRPETTKPETGSRETGKVNIGPLPLPLADFRRNLLRRLDSEKEMKGNERNSPCFTCV